MECCGRKAAGPDPCLGCKDRPDKADGRNNPLVHYALALASHLEKYRPDPDKVSWRDAQIFEAFQAAQGQHQREKIKEMERKGRGR